jgi:hypothetical protein
LRELGLFQLLAKAWVWEVLHQEIHLADHLQTLEMQELGHVQVLVGDTHTDLQAAEQLHMGIRVGSEL